MSADAPLYLALDQGGSSSRALVFDARGELVLRAQRDVPESRPTEERVEQDPEQLVRSLTGSLAEIAAGLGPRAANLRAAGLATQRSSLVCWDRSSGAALSPVLSWQDRRAATWLAQFAAHEQGIVRRTGLRLSPHYGASKLRWCLDNLAEVRTARDRGTLALGPLAAFLVFRLLDERPLCVDPANASRTLLWNLATRDWDADLCTLFGVPSELLPRCVPTRHAYGSLRVGPTRVPLSILTGDQSAALFAWGAPDPSTLYVNLGTGAFVQRPFHGDAPELPGLLRSVVLGERERSITVLEGTINGAGSALTLTARELGLADVEAHLDAWLDTIHGPPLFLNGISGLAAPFWRSDMRSRFIGDGPPEAKLVAVAESILFLVREIVEAMSAGASAPERILVSGGLSRSSSLCQRLADVLETPVERADEPEATARGLAGLLGAELHARSAPSRMFRPSDARRGLLPRWRAWRASLQEALRATQS